MESSPPRTDLTGSVSLTYVVARSFRLVNKCSDGRSRAVAAFLDFLQKSGDCHLVERTEEGFAVVRTGNEHSEAFNDLVREAMRRSGSDFVALPRTDGSRGYDQVLIIPVE
jgi:hypothetical protein